MTRSPPHYTLERSADGKEFWKLHGSKPTDIATLETRLFAEGGLTIYRGPYNGFRFPSLEEWHPHSPSVRTVYSLQDGKLRSNAQVHEYPDGKGHVRIDAGYEVFSADHCQTTHIDCYIDAFDYPALELKISTVMRRIWTHPHYLRIWARRKLRSVRSAGRTG